MPLLVLSEELALKLQLNFLKDGREGVGQERQLRGLDGAVAGVREVKALDRGDSKEPADVHHAVLPCLQQLRIAGVDGHGLKRHVAWDDGNAVGCSDRAEGVVPFALDFVGLFLVEWALHGEDTTDVRAAGEEALRMCLACAGQPECLRGVGDGADAVDAVDAVVEDVYHVACWHEVGNEGHVVGDGAVILRDDGHATIKVDDLGGVASPVTLDVGIAVALQQHGRHQALEESEAGHQGRWLFGDKAIGGVRVVCLALAVYRQRQLRHRVADDLHTSVYCRQSHGRHIGVDAACAVSQCHAAQASLLFLWFLFKKIHDV